MFFKIESSTLQKGFCKEKLVYSYPKKNEIEAKVDDIKGGKSISGK